MRKGSVRAGYDLAFGLIGAAALALGTPAFAGFVTGDGKGKAENDCLIELRVPLATASNMCTFQVALCVNQTNVPGCAGTALKTAFGKIKRRKLPAPSDLTGAPACGDSMSVMVPVKGKKKLHAGKATVMLKGISSGKGKSKRTDADKVVLKCDPQRGAMVVGQVAGAVCGNGVVENDEPCDPPCGVAPAGQTCNGLCQFDAAAACSCTGGTPTKIMFTTGTGTGICGSVKDAGGTVLSRTCVGGTNADMPCTVITDCPGGFCSDGNLTCGNLFFGGGHNAVPLPAVVPDMGLAVSTVCCSGTTLNMVGATPADVGGTNPERRCTTKDCLFGPPLPIPNASQANLSTCVINSLAENATGMGSCSTGETSVLNAPLTSTIFLTGDLLPFRCSNDGRLCLTPAPSSVECGGAACVNDFTDIQPCPICNTTTGKCNGGVNDGLPCTPADSPSLGAAYPTSHDCPVDPPECEANAPGCKNIGSLPIGFRLTTGTTTVSAANLTDQPGVFCGFCRDPDLFEFEKPAVECKSNADCAPQGRFKSCQQGQIMAAGAFGKTQARSISMTGMAAGPISTGGAPQASTLVSIFCIPPTFNVPIDNVADLPGPGAVSLPGIAQLLGECAANPNGGPRELALTVAQVGTDLDNGWTGIAHNFPVVFGAVLRICLTGCDTTANPSCAEDESATNAVNGATFGPPVPLFAAGIPVCIVSRYTTPKITAATADIQSGEVSATANLLTDVFVTSATQLCPRCSGSALGQPGTCDSGQRAGQACRTEGMVTISGTTYSLSSNCTPTPPPAGTLTITLSLTTGTSTLSGPKPCGAAKDDNCGGGACSARCTGAACVATSSGGECIDAKGGVSQLCCSNQTDRPCFPTAGGGQIVRTGTPGPPVPRWPDPTYPKSGDTALVATFCEPATGTGTVDLTTGLPGPGALILPGTTAWVR